MSFGALLKHMRLVAGMTQEALAEKAGVSAKAVSDLERDPTRAPRLETVKLLAEALDLDLDQRATLVAAARPHTMPVTDPPGTTKQGVRLPRPLTALIGREHEVATMTEALRDAGSRLLTLVGPGGVGKTRLAVHVAWSVADSFQHGAVFVDLSAVRDPSLVLTEIARHFEVRDLDATPVRDRLIALLSSKHLLLLLDNFEQVVTARDLVLDLIEACPRLAALVTSRIALQVRGERAFAVDPLPLPAQGNSCDTVPHSAAVTLFLERVRATGVDLPVTRDTASDIAHICRRLDGLPLAIELAAAWAPLLPPAALLAQLDRRLPLLVSGPHDLPARQKTMRNAIAWSYDLLEAQEQVLFRRLGVFVGGCALEAAQAVCGEPHEYPDMLRLTLTLVDKSLVRMSDHSAPEPRLTMLETVREYSLERLHAAGEAESLRQRHAVYYRALAEHAGARITGPDHASWVAVLEREHDNLRAALRWACDHADAVMGERLVVALTRFWSVRGYLQEGRRWLREIVNLAETGSDPPPASHVKALVAATTMALDQGAFDEAEELAARAMNLAQEPEDRMLALAVHGLLARQQTRYTDAVLDCERALSVAQELGNRNIEAEMLDNLATTLSLTGATDHATALFKQSLALFRAIGDVGGQANVMVGLARHAGNAGAHEDAETFNNEALALFRTLGDTGKVAEVLFGLGLVARQQGQYERATSLLEESLALRRERGDERSAAMNLGALAMTALNLGDVKRARALVTESMEVICKDDDVWPWAIDMTVLGHVDLAAGNIAEAENLFHESAMTFQTLGNLIYLPWCLEGLAGVAIAAGHAVRAARLCGARDALVARMGSSSPPTDPAAYLRTVSSIRAALGEIEWARHDEVGRHVAIEDLIAESSSGPIA
ncbi:MAG: hypothetical protein NVSMB22_21420 [Chloroflexota bacterium]